METKSLQFIDPVFFQYTRAVRHINSRQGNVYLYYEGTDLNPFFIFWGIYYPTVHTHIKGHVSWLICSITSPFGLQGRMRRGWVWEVLWTSAIRWFVDSQCTYLGLPRVNKTGWWESIYECRPWRSEGHFKFNTCPLSKYMVWYSLIGFEPSPSHAASAIGCSLTYVITRCFMD